MRQGPQPMMTRGFRAVSGRREGKVFETRFTETHGIQGLEGLVGIADRETGYADPGCWCAEQDSAEVLQMRFEEVTTQIASFDCALPHATQASVGQA